METTLHTLTTNRFICDEIDAANRHFYGIHSDDASTSRTRAACARIILDHLDAAGVSWEAVIITDARTITEGPHNNRRAIISYRLEV